MRDHKTLNSKNSDGSSAFWEIHTGAHIDLPGLAYRILAINDLQPKQDGPFSIELLAGVPKDQKYLALSQRPADLDSKPIGYGRATQ